MLIELSSWPKRRRPNTTGSRTAPKPFVSDTRWRIIKDLFEDPDPSPEGAVRELMLELVSKAFFGCSRTELVGKIYRRYPSPATCWRRRKAWTRSWVAAQGTWEKLIRIMDRRKLLDWSQAMGDGTFSPAKKGP
ncbi:MAG: hypothetical protein U0936_18450 [Planctomycetaceae bacterium]